MSSAMPWSDTTVSVHPTLGDVEDLKRARAEHDAVDQRAVAAQAACAHGADVAGYHPDEVLGGPTLGAIDELRFAHHAHACECGRGTSDVR